MNNCDSNVEIKLFHSLGEFIFTPVNFKEKEKFVKVTFKGQDVFLEIASPPASQDSEKQMH